MSETRPLVPSTAQPSLAAAAVGDASPAVPAVATPLPAADAPESALPATPSDIAGGLLAGIVAAVLASAIWYGVVVVSGWQVGLVAIAVGFLVGQGVVLGARKRGSVALVAISVVLTLLALVISEYLIVAHFVGQELAPGESLEILQAPDLVVSVVTESVTADPLTLVFWAIALFQAVAIPWQQVSRRRSQVG